MYVAVGERRFHVSVDASFRTVFCYFKRSVFSYTKPLTKLRPIIVNNRARAGSVVDACSPGHGVAILIFLRASWSVLSVKTTTEYVETAVVVVVVVYVVVVSRCRFVSGTILSGLVNDERKNYIVSPSIRIFR